jgi:endonuclease YncB( thermonuclease family)
VVIGVSDGDTITVRDSKNQQIKVRLAGIDAPEKGQDFGNVSKQNLSSLVFGKLVLLEGRKVDRYGRLIAKVLIGGTDVNLEQIRSGLAWHYKEYANEQSANDRRTYSDAEYAAQRARLKLWSVLAPVPPWEFRNGNGTPRPSVEKTRPLFQAPAPAGSGQIIGNRSSLIYHMPGCPSYSKVAPKNRVYFSSVEQAKAAGYRPARNC